eukprot:m.125177 g.125177  ORF g.125177 m.125177 type:complete len:657 (-) comp12975_c0_seq3:195-2165(-)
MTGSERQLIAPIVAALVHILYVLKMLLFTATFLMYRAISFVLRVGWQELPKHPPIGFTVYSFMYMQQGKVLSFNKTTQNVVVQWDDGVVSSVQRRFLRCKENPDKQWNQGESQQQRRRVTFLNAEHPDVLTAVDASAIDLNALKEQKNDCNDKSAGEDRDEYEEEQTPISPSAFRKVVFIDPHQVDDDNSGDEYDFEYEVESNRKAGMRNTTKYENGSCAKDRDNNNKKDAENNAKDNGNEYNNNKPIEHNHSELYVTFPTSTSHFVRTHSGAHVVPFSCYVSPQSISISISLFKKVRNGQLEWAVDLEEMLSVPFHDDHSFTSDIVIPHCVSSSDDIWKLVVCNTDASHSAVAQSGSFTLSNDVDVFDVEERASKKNDVQTFKDNSNSSNSSSSFLTTMFTSTPSRTKGLRRRLLLDDRGDISTDFNTSLADQHNSNGNFNPLEDIRLVCDPVVETPAVSHSSHSIVELSLVLLNMHFYTVVLISCSFVFLIVPLFFSPSLSFSCSRSLSLSLLSTPQHHFLFCFLSISLNGKYIEFSTGAINIHWDVRQWGLHTTVMLSLWCIDSAVPEHIAHVLNHGVCRGSFLWSLPKRKKKQLRMGSQYVVTVENTDHNEDQRLASAPITVINSQEISNIQQTNTDIDVGINVLPQSQPLV